MKKLYLFNFDFSLDHKEEEINLNLIVGENYIRKILRQVRSYNDPELELKFEIIRALILREINIDIWKTKLSQAITKKESITINDKSFFEEMSDIMTS